MLSNAKVNLFLHVTGKYENGYHKLESLMIPINLYDRLDIKLSNTSDTIINITGEFAPLVSDCDNLVHKMIDQIFAYVEQKPANFIINLEKNIPVGAGLGGASSNCAFGLKAINNIMQFGLKDSELKKIALTLGADVPFFIDNKPAIIKGIGEVSKFAKLPDLHILLVFPNKSLSTKQVFELKPIELKQAMVAENSFEDTDTLIEYLSKCTNSVYKNSVSLLDDVQIITNNISIQNGCRLSRMTGSGSCCFGIFDSKDSLNDAAINIKKYNCNWWVKTLETI